MEVVAMSTANPRKPIKEEPEAPPDLEELLAEAKSGKWEDQLKEWGIDLEKLKARAEKAGGDARVEFDRQAQTLRPMMSQAQAKLVELRKAGGEASVEMLKGVDSAFTELKKAFASAAAKFKP